MSENANKVLSIFKKFFHAIWFLIRGYFIVVGFILTLSIIVISVATTSKLTPKPEIGTGPFILTLTFDGSIAENEPAMYELLLQRLLGEKPSLYLPNLRATLRRAASDDRVKGLHVNLHDLNGSWSEFAELRQIFQTFQESEKPIHIFLSSGDNLSYFLASVANSISHAPTGGFMMPGPAFQLVYFGKALRDLGIDVEVVRQGKFKSAFEPLIRNAPSPETLEMYTTMEASLRSYIVDSVVETRKAPKEKVRKWFEQGIFTSEDALKERMVDTLCYVEDSEEILLQQTSSETKVAVEDYEEELGIIKSSIEEQGSQDQSLALIEAFGEIVMSSGAQNPGRSEEDDVTPLRLADEISWAKDEDKVKAVVLRISSPGGSAVASDLIWEEVRKLAATKPVVVSVGEMAASGGYYIAAPASRIVAEPASLVGSIGVIGMNLHCEACEKKYGVSFHMITQSARKKFLNLGEKSTSNDLTLLEHSMDEVYRVFVKKVSEGRNIPIEAVEKLAEGRVYTALQAKKLGLVDELGGLWDSFQAAKSLAGLDVNKLYPVMRYPEEKFPLDFAFSIPLKGLLSHYTNSFATPSIIGSGGKSLLRRGVRLDHENIQEWLIRKVVRWQRILSNEPYAALWPDHVLLSF